MKNKHFWTCFIGILLVFGLILSGCDSSTGGGGGSSNPGAPGTPTGIGASATSDNGIIVTWASVSDATGYRVYRGTGSNSLSFIKEVTGTSYTDPGLTVGTTYYYAVKAYNSAGESGFSSTASAKPSGNIPGTPTGLSVSINASNSVVVKWNAVSGVTGYRVYRSTSGFDLNQMGTQVGTSTSTSYTDSGLLSNQVYYYRVAAYNADGQSSYSSVVYTYTPYAVGTSLEKGDGIGKTFFLSAGTTHNHSINASTGSLSIGWDDSDNKTGSPSGMTGTPYADVKVGILRSTNIYAVGVNDTGNSGLNLHAITISGGGSNPPGTYTIVVQGYDSSTSGVYTLYWY